MAYTAEPRYTEKIDVMVKPEMADYIQKVAEQEKVSKSSVVRDLLEAGRVAIEESA